MVFATAVRLLGSPAEAEDVAQTVFLRAFQRFGEIGSSPAAAGWLKTVTRNACLNHLSRYRARWRLFSELGRPDAEDSEAGYEAGAGVRRLARAGPGTGRAARASGGRASPAPRSPARTHRALSLRRHELPGHRRRARRVSGQGEDRHPPGPRGSQKAAHDRSCIPLIWKPSSAGNCGGFPMPRAPHTLLPRVLAAVEALGAAAVVRTRVVHLAARLADRVGRCADPDRRRRRRAAADDHRRRLVPRHRRSRDA